MFLASRPKRYRRSSLPSDRDGWHRGPPSGHRFRPGLETFGRPPSLPEGLPQTRIYRPACLVRRSEIAGFRGPNRRSERRPPSLPDRRARDGLPGTQSRGERRSLPRRMTAKKLRPTVSISPSIGLRSLRNFIAPPAQVKGKRIRFLIPANLIGAEHRVKWSRRRHFALAHPRFGRTSISLLPVLRAGHTFSTCPCILCDLPSGSPN